MKSFALSLVSVALVLILAETGARVFSSSPPILSISKPYRTEDPKLGIRLIPNREVSVSLQKNGKALYNAKYLIDDFGHRKTPQSPSLKKHFLLFHGCSFTFGEGVGQTETLPAAVAKYKNSFHIYNFGVGGYGPNNILAHIKSPEFKNEIKELRGIFIYTLINHHLPRALGPMSVINSGGADMPDYELKGEEFITHGSWRTMHPWRTRLYEIMGMSRFLKVFNIDWPMQVTDANRDFVAHMIFEIKKEFLKKFNCSDFYVLIWPGATEAARLKPFFDKYKVNYLDYSHLPLKELTEGNDKIPLDTHPTAQAYEIVATKLALDIK
jgi:hypothetical protein